MGYIDLTGQRFGKVIAIEKTALRSSSGSVMWKCKCDCGNEKLISAKCLKDGKTKSCGCLIHETKNAKHGLSDTKIYSIWDSMMSRCYNQKNKSYSRYGERGITVCDEWHKPKVFYDWSISHGYSDELTIDRIDNDKGYSPDNCRWVTRKEQMNNYSKNRLLTYNGKTQTIAQWADEFNIKRSTLSMRLNNYKWNIEKALTTKPNK